ncbi:abortive infection family protein [Companilactobacillus kimchiensis]|uniref:Abortive infection protein-like C-terminal domain-containing protein n=1 Tax=Companilactobacillus kimchiensis TaxID=993692 RepID=A0A0R2LG68_9LACO|nr:abortive infection family protein [Companilactobacillus kimchiensis]KRO00471.1 hypothetical protein IV57_GL000906 [Companilactobacillus kimchiensis]
MKYPIKILRPEVDSYNIASVSERYQKMNNSYSKEDYGETVNYARSMVESACKYVYKQIKNSDMDDKFKFLSLPNIVEKCLDVLSKEMSLPNSYKKLSSNMIDTITELGKIRNATSVSHGSAKRTIEVSAPEAKYAVFMAEGFVVFILELLFNRTHSLKKNAIGSVIDPKGMEKTSDSESLLMYKENQFNATYMVTPGNNVIYQVEIHLPGFIDFDKDEEFFSDYIQGFVEDDVHVEDKEQTGINKYQYYSPKKDFFYEVTINKDTNELFISRDYSKN